jgi:hypothetical protein
MEPGREGASLGEAERHPIRLVVEDDLQRSRLTVFFRLLLAIPHFVWLLLWSIAVVVVALVNWFATLVLGRSPQWAHDFLGAYLRYATHLYAYLYLAANPYPGFSGSPGSYPVDVEIDPPVRQRRSVTLFRLVLALPALALTSVLAGGGFGGGGGGGGGGRDGDAETLWTSFGGAGAVAVTVAILAWFVCLARGRMPSGFRDLLAYALRYSAQTYGYLLLLTDRYPNSDPAWPGAAAPPARPTVRILVEDDRRRSRLTVLFRGLLFLPHLVWYLLWTVAVVLAVIVSWVVTLATGRTPAALHRFLAAYVRYDTHIFAYLFMVANPFPGFTGTAGTYPVDLDLDPAARQNRWVTLGRLFLAIPALLVTSALNSVLVIVGIFGWFASLVLGRMPEGLRNLGAYALRYSAQTLAFLYLLTDRYPYSGPWEFAARTPEPAEPAAPEPGIAPA